MRALETLVRAVDQLDEQLHAGTFQYILTSSTHFFAYDQFLWAFGFGLGGLLLPVVLQAVTHKERVKSQSKTRDDYSQVLAILYMLMAYGLGICFFLLPELYQRLVRVTTENEYI